MVKIFTPVYSKLKARDKEAVREKCYSDIIMQSLTSMFNYNHSIKDPTFKRAIDSRLEEMLRIFGKVAFFQDDKGVLKFGECHFINSKNEFDWIGTSNGVTITTMDGCVYEREIGADCVVMGNNNLFLSELNIYRFIEQLSQVDLSQVDLLINARSHPIIVTKSESDAEVIRKAIENNKSGIPLTVATTQSLARANMGVDSEPSVLTITDPQTATLFQYYSHYHLDLTSRLYGMYGLSTFNTGKMAQTNDLEVSGSLASSMVIPLNNYKARKTACEDIAKMFDIEFEVEFADPWKNQLAILQGINKEEYNVEEEEVTEENEVEEDVKGDEDVKEDMED